MALRTPTTAHSRSHRTEARGDGRPRRLRGAEQRGRILDAAVEHLSRRGFRGTSIAELAVRCGTTHSNLLYYFGSKRRLLEEVVAERERAEAPIYQRALGSGDASLGDLSKVARLNARNPVLTRLYHVLAPENLDNEDVLHDFFVKRHERARQIVAAACEADIRRGLIRTGTDPVAVGREVIAILMGAELQWLMDPEGFDLVETIDCYLDGLYARLAPGGDGSPAPPH